MSSPDSQQQASDHLRLRPYLREAAATVMLFIVLMEWLMPLTILSEYTDLHMLRPFMIAFGLFIIVDYSRLPLTLGWMLKLIVCICLIGILFYRDDWWSFSWLDSYLMETVQDVVGLVQFELSEISPHNRTLLFLLGWALLIDVMYTTVVVRQQALWLIAATIVYLIGLQLWAGIDTSWGVLRASAAGMVLMAVNQMLRVEQEFKLRQRLGAWTISRWTAAVAIVVLVAIGAGLWLSKDEMRLVKPLAWNPFTSTAWTALFPDSTTKGGDFPGADVSTKHVSLTGYSSDDSMLGGPVHQDDSIAFTARTERPTYWRGESRSTYTGSGWIVGGLEGVTESAISVEAVTDEMNPAEALGLDNDKHEHDDSDAVNRLDVSRALNVENHAVAKVNSTEAVVYDIVAEVDVDQSVDNLPRQTSANAIDAELESFEALSEATLDAEEKGVATLTEMRHVTIQQEVLLDNIALSKQLFAGGPIVGVETLVTRKGVSLDTGLLTLDPLTGRMSVRDSALIGYYRVAVEVPLDQTGIIGGVQARTPRPLTEAERLGLANDLQLPVDLPNRVRELASTVTAHAMDDYSRVLAIEEYLRNEYTYSLDKPTYPSGGQDFVDHFLFDEKLGYCNHFSTAMVVMLRTLGVPARWVKGFAPGELDADQSSVFDDSLMSYTILNKDAHSWVEAYFPEAGWVSFEPTPGFTPAGGLGFDPLNTHDTNTASAAAYEISATEGGHATSWISNAWAWMKDGWRQWKEWTVSTIAAIGVQVRLQLEKRPLIGIFVSLSIITILLVRGYRKARTISARQIQLQRRSGVDQEVVHVRALHSFDSIWAKLGRKLGARRPEQTVREYVHSTMGRLTEEDQREALLQLVELYEVARYSEETMLSRNAKVHKTILGELFSRIARSKTTGNMP